uniref:Putative salivary secreted protein n=1 Tax=Ixodes ricinus TaxID=34613 RepID=A0A090X888_IXORI
MISARILLLLAGLALACIAVGSTNQGQGKPEPGNGCPHVSEDSFQRLNKSLANPPKRPSASLGRICESNVTENVRCIGDPNLAFLRCRLCCACSGGAGVTYFDTNAPDGFPCKTKGKDKCNSNGKCENKKQ